MTPSEGGPTFVNKTRMIARLLALVIFVSTCLAQQPQPSVVAGEVRDRRFINSTREHG